MDNSIHFQTVADKVGQIIDQSVLYFSLNFSAVPYQAIREATIHYCNFVNDFFRDEFVFLWEWNGSKKKKLFSPTIDEQRKVIFNDNYPPNLVVDAFVRSEAIYAKKHINAFNRTLYYSGTIPNSEYSTDFESYFTENIVPTINDDSALKQAVIDLVNKEGKKPLAYNRMNDALGSITTWSEGGGTHLYHGRIYFGVSADCLGENIHCSAKLFAAELKDLCTMLNYAGGSVGIAPWQTLNPSPYLRYFASANDCDLDQDCPDGCDINEWNKVAFVCDCTWGNVLAPVARKKLFPNDLHVSESELSVEELPNHGIYVQLNKGPEAVDVNDLIRLKRFLYPALYPGKKRINFLGPDGEIRLYYFPRHWWEKVPVFSEEISVQNGIITFEYKNDLFGSCSQ